MTDEREISEKHSAFATSFPIYIYTSKTEEVPDVDETETETETETASASPVASETSAPEPEAPAEPKDEDEAIIEDAEPTPSPSAAASDADADEEGTPLKMKTVVQEDWVHVNAQPPIWTRYVTFQDLIVLRIDFTHRAHIATRRRSLTRNTKSSSRPRSRTTGTRWRGAISRVMLVQERRSRLSFIFLLRCKSPHLFLTFHMLKFRANTRPNDFWSGPTIDVKDVRIHNKRVFITNDLGEDALPKWMSWIKAIVDGTFYFLTYTPFFFR